MTRRAFVIWCAFVPVAILNGAIRDLWIAPETGAAAAHVISTLTLCLAIVALASVTIAWMRPFDAHAAFRIGAWWLVLTLAFEFLAGHFVFGTPWGQLLADYDVSRGRIWILVPLTTAVAPGVAARLRSLLGDAALPARAGGRLRPRAGGAS
jgi:hypothetical protein